MKVATTKDYTVIEGLERTSNYCVWVRPYTRIGAANATKDLILPDQIGNMNDSLLILEHWRAKTYVRLNMDEKRYIFHKIFTEKNSPIPGISIHSA